MYFTRNIASGYIVKGSIYEYERIKRILKLIYSQLIRTPDNTGILFSIMSVKYIVWPSESFANKLMFV